ncbi:NADPH-dependent pterin aldehyde reductase [Nymphaea colorata]|nr:NADPH-dependent pterin aldehyde reductase [Nymphaea colorata]
MAPEAAAAATKRKLVFVTGIGRGLGRALAVELAKRGHNVAGCSKTEEHVNSLSSLLSSIDPELSHSLFTADVRSDSAIAEVAKSVLEKRGCPDIIVNNAGAINKNNKIWDVPLEEFDNVIDTNIKGTANVMRHFLPAMIQRKHGVIVNFSSGWGRSAAAQVAPYCASKWAIEGLSRSVAKEVPPGIAIVALSPGVINTELLHSCFGESAELYQSTETWAPNAAAMILRLTADDNGASLTV